MTNNNSAHFIVKNIPFDTINENNFITDFPEEFITGPDVFTRPHLLFELECPRCQNQFTIDYYGGAFTDDSAPCPACGAVHRLYGPDVQAQFANQMRNELGQLTSETQWDAKLTEEEKKQFTILGEILAKAAILLEPLCMIFIVRFCHNRIGHYILNTVNFISLMDDILPRPALLFALPPRHGQGSNLYLTELYSRYFSVTPAAMVAEKILEKLPGHRATHTLLKLPLDPPQIQWAQAQSDDYKASFEHLPVHSRHSINLDEHYWIFARGNQFRTASDLFVFTDEETKRAEEWLADHGISGNTEYVTFLGRDSLYLKLHRPDFDFSYHDYRNMDINTYVPAMKWLEQHDIHAIRMGSLVQERLDVASQGILDYPFLDRSEFMDIYLLTRPLFMVTCGSGPDILAFYLKRPFLYINYPLLLDSLSTVNSPTILVTCKNLWSLDENKFLSFREILSRGFGCVYRKEQFEALGLTLVDNTAEEILEIVQEMYARVRGTYQSTPEEDRLQDAFKRLLAEFYPGFEFQGKLAYSFLRRHPYLLADA